MTYKEADDRFGWYGKFFLGGIFLIAFAVLIGLTATHHNATIDNVLLALIVLNIAGLQYVLFLFFRHRRYAKIIRREWLSKLDDFETFFNLIVEYTTLGEQSILLLFWASTDGQARKTSDHIKGSTIGERAKNTSDPVMFWTLLTRMLSVGRLDYVRRHNLEPRDPNQEFSDICMGHALIALAKAKLPLGQFDVPMEVLRAMSQRPRPVIDTSDSTVSSFIRELD